MTAETLTRTPVTSPFYRTRGPSNASVMVVGEAFGADEDRHSKPFVGASGQELNRMLTAAGIDPETCIFTNVVNARPERNDFTRFLISNSSAKKLSRFQDVYPNAQLSCGIQSLHELIRMVKPSIIISLGNWALWALTNKARVKTEKGYRKALGIDSMRGSMYRYEHGGLSIPVLPTYHPAAIFRNWSYRHIAIQDLRKVTQFLAGTRPWSDPRTFNWEIAPGPANVRKWVDRVLATADDKIELTLDLETFRGLIHIFGVKHGDSCLCIPFFHIRGQVKNPSTTPVYSRNSHIAIWLQLRRLLTDPRVTLVGQNLVFDAQYLAYWFAYKPKIHFDTMIAQHICFKAERKSLDFMASIYCTFYEYWKDDRKTSIVNESTKLACEYNCKDLEYTHEITTVLCRVLTDLDAWKLFHERIHLTHILLDMMYRGVRMDSRRRITHKIELELEIGRVIEWLEGAIPDNLKPPTSKSGVRWWASSSQLMTLLYDTMKLNPVRDKKTGNRTLAKDAMEILSERYPGFRALFGMIVILRSMNTIHNNLLKKYIDPDGRVRCAYNPVGTKSDRLSSSENVFDRGFNLQNILRTRDPINPFTAIEELT